MIDLLDRGQIGTFEDATDWTPSWENSFRAVERIPDALLVLGAYQADQPVGVLTYTPLFNWIMNLVVRPRFRRRGVAMALLGGLASRLGSPAARVKLLNVDRSDHGMMSFLDRCGFEHTIDQYEMSRDISPTR